MAEIVEIRNPFKIVEGDIIEAFKKEYGGVYEYAEVSSGEVSMFQKVSKSKRVIVDRANYVKVYKHGQDLVKDLSDSGVRLFLYIAIHLGVHQDTIFLYQGTVCEWCGFKRATYFNTLSELVKKNVVAKRGDSIEYFVNPNFIFNGSRLKL
jgi:hypothetical protein